MRRILVLLTLASAAWVVACGGGTSHSVSNPTTGQTIEAKTALPAPSATAVVETPTVAPTATAEANLTPEQIAQIASQVKDLISTGLSEVQVTKAAITLAGGDIRYLDPAYVAGAFADCDISKYGQPFYSVNLAQTVEPSVTNYSTVFLANCMLPADASKALFKATGDQRFRQANEAWKPASRQIFEGVRAKDSRIDESAWQGYEFRFFISQ